METFLADLAYSLRMFRRSPGFTLAAVAALALGIGANTAIFSVVNAVLLKPVPFPEPDRLVDLHETRRRRATFPARSPAKFAHWRRQADVVAGRRRLSVPTSSTSPAAAARAAAGRAGVAPTTSGSFGVPARPRARLHGGRRPPGRRKCGAAQPRASGQRRFGGDPSDRSARPSRSSGEPYTVIGIVGPRFDVARVRPAARGLDAVPARPATPTDQGHYFQVAGRLQARRHARAGEGARCRSSAAGLPAAVPDRPRPEPERSASQPAARRSSPTSRPTLLRPARRRGARAAIACANVANLLLVRATGRTREIAIRAAIGAGRGRIIRQLLTESVLLSLAGGVSAWRSAWSGIRALLAINTAGLPRVGEDGASSASTGACWRFTLPRLARHRAALRADPGAAGLAADLSATLKESAAARAPASARTRRAACWSSAEVALALVLLIGSALLIRTLVALRTVGPGFDAEQRADDADVADRAAVSEQSAAVEQAGARRRRAPGRDCPASRSPAPPAACRSKAATACRSSSSAGRSAAGPVHGGGGWMTISPGYFEVFRIPVKRGRTLQRPRDRGAPPVVIINEAMARQFWQDGDPLNDRLIIGRGVMREFAERARAPDHRRRRRRPRRRAQQRSGADDVHPAGAGARPANALNVRITPMAWVVRTRGPPASLSGPIRRRCASRPACRSRTSAPMTEVVSRSTSRAAVQHVADDGVRRVGAAARGDRHLRPDGLLGRSSGRRRSASASRSAPSRRGAAHGRRARA